jgi:hypothetical protein
MARKSSGKRGAPIIALIAVFAALAGPGAASAATTTSLAPVVAPAGIVASWFEDASWAEG